MKPRAKGNPFDVAPQYAANGIGLVPHRRPLRPRRGAGAT